MAKFKTIYAPNSAFGGYEYRATSDGKTVNVQEKSPKSSSFITRKVMSLADFESWAEEKDIRNPYNDNPAHISKLCNDQS